MTIPAVSNDNSGVPLSSTNNSSGNTSAPSAAGGTSGTSTSNSSLSTGELNQLSNPQLFLQLLIAELQNQDPTNPMNPSTILSQTANLSQMEAVTSMTSAVSSEEGTQEAGEATTLIGKSVAATVNDAPIDGTVSQVQLSATSSPVLLIDGTAVPLADVTTVNGSSTPTSAGGAAGAGSSTPTSAGGAAGGATADSSGNTSDTNVPASAPTS